MNPDFDGDALARATEEAAKLQQQMMQQMYAGNPELLAQMQQQMQQQMAAVQNTTEQISANPMGFLQSMMDDDPDFETLNEALSAVEKFEELPAVSAAKGGDAAKRFGILLSGVVSNLNGHELDALAVEEKEPFFIQKVTDILSGGWGIENREELLEKLDSLTKGGGHTARYAAYCDAADYASVLTPDMDEEDRESAAFGWAFVQNNRAAHPAKELLGWDYGRAAMVARWGFFLGYISREECEAFLESCAQVAADAFSSWRQFGASYLFGGCFWSSLRGGDEAVMDYIGDIYPALAELMDPTEGSWATHPWIKELT